MRVGGRRGAEDFRGCVLHGAKSISLKTRLCRNSCARLPRIFPIHVARAFYGCGKIQTTKKHDIAAEAVNANVAQGRWTPNMSRLAANLQSVQGRRIKHICGAETDGYD